MTKKNKKQKTKTCSMEKNQNLILACVVRSNLFPGREVQNLPRQKSCRPMCFFCHPHQIPTEIFLKRKYGDKTNMAPRMQSIYKYMMKRN
jgi:NifB/MoaA-like Fe-S oxidoreductase